MVVLMAQRDGAYHWIIGLEVKITIRFLQELNVRKLATRITVSFAFDFVECFQLLPDWSGFPKFTPWVEML